MPPNRLAATGSYAPSTTMGELEQAFVPPMEAKKQKLVLETKDLAALRVWHIPLLMNGRMPKLSSRLLDHCLNCARRLDWQTAAYCRGKGNP